MGGWNVQIRKIAVVGIAMLTLVLTFGPIFTVQARIPALVLSPTPAASTLVDGVFEILSPSDFKTWHFTFQTGVVIRVTVGYYSIGDAILRMDVASQNIEFNVFCQQFSQESTAGATETWQFAVPAGGEHIFNLSLIDSVDFAIAVYVKIETNGFISNAYTSNAGPAGTPLFKVCVFTSDDAGVTRMFNVTLNHDTIYWFSAATLTPFDYRYEEQGQVRVWAYLESVATGARHALAAGGLLGASVLTWKSTWFGISANGTYRLNVTVATNQTYRLGIGLSIAQYRASGNSSQDSQTDPQLEDSDPNPFLSVDNIIVLGAVVGGIVVVAAVIGKFSKRSLKTRAGMVAREF